MVTHQPNDQRAYRLTSVDALRGLVMVIMALDHVRDHFCVGGAADPVRDPDVPLVLFATRWVTHFCAPVFVLLAGVSAGLASARRSRAQLARFLLVRGLWLIAVEWFVISTAWTFAPAGLEIFEGQFVVMLQVIWAIGACMIVLAGVQFLGRPTCLIMGTLIVCAHNLLDGHWPPPGGPGDGLPLWAALHVQMWTSAGPFAIMFVYPLLSWVGVMLCGFGCASLFELPAARRNLLLRIVGASLTAAFFVLRGANIYGDANGWAYHGDAMRTGIDFFNTTKYPPSLLFLLMTIGPALLLCGFFDKFTGWIKDALVILGRVPFAFYVAHVYLIHVLSLVLGVIQGFEVHQFLTLFALYPEGYGIPLYGVYLVWIGVVAALYPFCRWVAALKSRRRDWWLSYV